LPIGKEIFRFRLPKRLSDKISEMTDKSRGFLSRYRSIEMTVKGGEAAPPVLVAPFQSLCDLKGEMSAALCR